MSVKTVGLSTSSTRKSTEIYRIGPEITDSVKEITSTLTSPFESNTIVLFHEYNTFQLSK